MAGKHTKTDDTRTEHDEAEHQSVARRNLLRYGGVAAAGAALAAVASAVDASPAGATTGNMQYGAGNDAGTDTTGLVSTASRTLQLGNDSTSATIADGALYVSTNSTGPAIRVDCFNAASPGQAAVVVGGGNLDGILATSSNGVGVRGDVPGSGGLGVYGSSTNGTGVYASADGNFPALVADASGPGPAAALVTDSGGTGIAALVAVENTGSTSDALDVENWGSGVALNTSDNGLGTGSALNAHLDTPTNASDVIVATTAGTGRALAATATKVTNTADAATITHAGKGRGININLSNTANAADALTVTQHGTGKGVDAMAGPGTAVAATAGSGIGVLATVNTATGTNPAVKAQSNGKGQAVLAATTANATMPTVQATSGSTQPAVQANGNAAGTGPALDVHGKATFTRSGVLTVPAAASNAMTAAVPGGLTATSHVLATIQLNSGTLAVRAAVPILSGTNINKIQIFLTGNAPTGGAAVGWFVFG